jgi:hypothetical protein
VREFIAECKENARRAQASQRAPEVREHAGMLVVRDDLFPGGTKARFLPRLFDGAEEVVYASPAEGGAETALATVAAARGTGRVAFLERYRAGFLECSTPNR